MRIERIVPSCFSLILVIAATVPGHYAAAQPYPRQAVRIIVPFAPGGGGDTIARTVGQKLNEMWGQPVVVDNRGGANTIIGTELAAKSKPDGYTLFLAIATHAINPALYPKLPYNTAADFAPVTLMAQYAFVLTTHPSVPAKSVRELIALAQARPGALSCASSGNGSGPHLTLELFKSMAGGIDIVHVPYKGAGPANIDLVSGQVQVFFNNFLAAMPLIRAGRIRVLAVTSSKRSNVMPEVPTLAESGLSGFDVTGWYGVLVPAGTPEAIVAKLQSDIAAVLRMPEISSRLSSEGAVPVGSTAEQFAKFLQTETEKWAKVIREARIRIE